MANNKIKIFINDNKNQITINAHNVSKNCDRILDAFKKNHTIKYNIQWNAMYKDTNVLLNVMAKNIILKLSDKIDLFLNDNISYEVNQIYNLNFLMHILFVNNLIMKNFMNDVFKWKKLFVLFKKLLLHKHIMNPKCLSLAVLLSQTQIYWTIEHIRYLNEIEFYKAMCIGIKKSYFKNDFINVHNIVCSITYNYYVIVNNQQETQFWYTIFKRFMDQTLFRQKPQLTKKHKPSTKWLVSCCEYISFINKYKNIVFDTEDNKIKSSYKKYKVCAYLKCSKLKTKKNKIKMKICKGCMLVYYCSRKCQKHDWNLKHRTLCQKL